MGHALHLLNVAYREVLPALAVLAAIGAAWYAKRQADATSAATDIARRAEQSAETSATASVQSAEAAKASARIAEESLRLDQDRQHDLLAPDVTHEAIRRKARAGQQHDSLWVKITNNAAHDYRMSGHMLYQAEGAQQAIEPLDLHAKSTSGEINLGHIGLMAPDVLVLFFDGPDCPCAGRRAATEGHWSHIVKVDIPPEKKMIVMK